MQPSYWHYPRYTTLHQSKEFKPCWLVSLIYCSRIYFTWLNVEKLRGTRWRFSYFLQCFQKNLNVLTIKESDQLEGFFFTRVENISFSGPVHSELSLYLLCGSQILYPGRLGWDERCERTILSVFALISMITHYCSSDVVRLQRGRDSFLFVDVCFFYECCHAYMHSWVSALMVTRLWYRHRWRSQQQMQWSQTYFKSKLCCMSHVNLK